MCRLFGFRSIINSRVHHSLASADNALNDQSTNHPDGWGVAYYIGGAPHMVKSVQPAFSCNLFHKISGIVSSQTVVAHIRNATLGQATIVNTHPFQYGQWTFAHNGNIKNFNHHRNDVLKLIPEELSRFILGDTDSEVFFYFLLSKLSENFGLTSQKIEISKISMVVQKAIEQLIDIIGPYSEKDDAGVDETYLTFLLTNGEIMLGHQAGKNLYYSTYKKKCVDRDICSSFSDVCEAPTQTGLVNHLQFTSEPLSGENVWIPMKNGQTIGVDRTMNLYISS